MAYASRNATAAARSLQRSSWAAGATSGDSFVKVSVAGAGASADRALDLLRETLARRGG